MNVTEQLVLEKLKRYNEHLMNSMHDRAIWNFYMAYCMACAELRQPVNRSVNVLWKKFISSSNSKDTVLAQLLREIEKDMVVVNDFLKMCAADTDQDYKEGGIWKEGTIGVLSQEWDYG